MHEWWKEELVYQIYPRSFQDSNGDGIGDIPGITGRLDEIAALGAGVIWLSPVYASPQIDNGYDISDYRSIDPIFGTLADMDTLIAEAQRRGIRIIMDLVINHTSDRHEWFEKSRRREPGYEDYYIWRPGRNRPPPNNWTSFFMEGAWSHDEVRGEWYLHLFHQRQPDLNYRSPRVLEEIEAVMRFWLDRGIAGFRCDVINVLWKESLEDGAKSLMLTGLEHYKCREGLHDILRRLRRNVLDRYDCFTVGESAMITPAEARLLTGKERGELDMIFYFDHLEVDRRFARFIPKPFRAVELLRRLAVWQTALEWNAVYLESHDQSRIVSHYGDSREPGVRGGLWERSAKLLAMLQFTLRGTPFLYQGQEIGMTNFDFAGMDEVKDIETHNLNRLMKRLCVPAPLRWKWLRISSRDNARTPYQWNGEPGAGFTAGRPWLGINGNRTLINYEAQRGDPESVLSFYKSMIAFRAGSETLKYGAFTPLYADRRLIVYRREAADAGGDTFTVILNCSPRRVKLGARAAAALSGRDAAYRVVVSNTGRTGGVLPSRLEPWEAATLREA